MNPNASTFVPKFGTGPISPPSPVSSQTETPAHVYKPLTLSIPSTKKVEETIPKEVTKKEETPKDQETTLSPSTAPKKEFSLAESVSKIELEDGEEPITEEERRELKRMAEEEGITEEELLKESGKEEEPELKEALEDSREHLNVVFIGHVDAGKSTISGQILYATGKVDQRTIEKYEKESKDKNRESWFLAYILDTNEEERAKGKTVEVGRATFETATKRYTILDAPGHKNYVPNMIGGASQADVGILVISAKKGEFESGFLKGGQTREHSVLAKTLGIKYLVVVINKMDDETVGWDKVRYDEIEGQLLPFLKGTGYNPKDVYFVPVSGLKGTGIKDDIPEGVANWYTGKGLINTLDELKIIDRNSNFPLRLLISDKYKDRGYTCVMGKIEAGIVNKGDNLVVMPGKTAVEVMGIMLDETTSVKRAKPGENVRVFLKGIDEESVHRGYVLCDAKQPVPCVTRFECQLAIVELLPTKSIFTNGYKGVIHAGMSEEECGVVVLLDQLDNKTLKSVKKKPAFVKEKQLARAILEVANPLPCEIFTDVPQLGRFTFRDSGKTIAIGKVLGFGPKKATNN